MKAPKTNLTVMSSFNIIALKHKLNIGISNRNEESFETLKYLMR
jgi:hypothetical protein